ncbi:MAG: AmmeMemoRadiSam system protein A [Acidobacteriota bacterium]
MEIKNPAEAPQLSCGERRILLDIARGAITAAAHNEVYRVPRGLPAALQQPQGTFVSLHIHGKLRGCIGVLHASRTLAQAVAHCACSAALRDPRFPPLEPQELPETVIEVSVLGCLRLLEHGRMPSPGVDGVMVDQGSQQGLLLPQVATEFGWDAERLLAETCHKAGLAPDAWRRGARVRVFQAQVFSEEGAT